MWCLRLRLADVGSVGLSLSAVVQSRQDGLSFGENLIGQRGHVLSLQFRQEGRGDFAWQVFVQQVQAFDEVRGLCVPALYLILGCSIELTT